MSKVLSSLEKQILFFIGKSRSQRLEIKGRGTDFKLVEVVLKYFIKSNIRREAYQKGFRALHVSLR